MHQAIAEEQIHARVARVDPPGRAQERLRFRKVSVTEEMGRERGERQRRVGIVLGRRAQPSFPRFPIAPFDLDRGQVDAGAQVVGFTLQ